MPCWPTTSHRVCPNFKPYFPSALPLSHPVLALAPLPSQAPFVVDPFGLFMSSIT